MTFSDALQSIISDKDDAEHGVKKGVTNIEKRLL